MIRTVSKAVALAIYRTARDSRRLAYEYRVEDTIYFVVLSAVEKRKFLTFSFEV